MKTQKICTSILLIFLCFVSFFIGYTKSFSVPVYADSVPEGYSPCGFNDQVDAFLSYCYSRNLAIEGSGLDALTSFTSDAYQGLLKKSGFDVNELQNEIYKRTKDNLGAKWFFTSVGISAYNRMFAEFLQNNGLEVGDSITDDTLYSGSKFTDNNGKTSLIWYISGFKNEYNSGSDVISAKGSVYLDGSILVNAYPTTGEYDYEVPITSYITNSNIQQYVAVRHTSSSYQVRTSVLSGRFSQGNYLKYENSSTYGNLIIVRNIADGNLYLATISYTEQYDNVTNYTLKSTNRIKETSENVVSNVTITVSTNNNVINNNNYEGDTYITNEGDVIEGDTTINYNPYPDGGGSSTGSGTVGGSGSDGTINFPDINFNLPDINWSLGDLSQKFPFSIPFDLISFFTLINAEPEAPRIDAEIPLGSWYTWEFEADFGQFESYASIIRNVEFIGFCVGLIYITIRLVKG